MFSTKPLRGEICGLSLYRKANPRYSRASLRSVLGCFSSLVIVHRHCYLMGRGGEEEEEDGRYSCSCSYSCYAMICWYGYGFFDVILPPRKQKKVDGEKGADGRMIAA